MNNIIALIVLGVIVYGFVMVYEFTNLHVRYDGKMKRGMGIFSERLPDEIKEFFYQLQNDIYYEDTGVFIKKRDDEVLVQYFPIKKSWRHQLKGGGAMLYVGYINLSARTIKLQYRISISPLLLFLAIGILFLSVVDWNSVFQLDMVIFIGIVLLVGVFIHLYQREKVLEFIREEIKTYFF
jgi:hypothetical protein